MKQHLSTNKKFFLILKAIVYVFKTKILVFYVCKMYIFGLKEARRPQI